jgi:hypothetical protein
MHEQFKEEWIILNEINLCEVEILSLQIFEDGEFSFTIAHLSPS